MARIGLAFAWLVPLIVAIEFIGSSFAQSIGSTLGLLALFLGALWLPIAADPSEEPASDRRMLRALRVAGVLLLLVGGSVLVFGLVRILEPARIPPTSLPEWLRRHEWTVLVPIFACWPLALSIPWISGKRLSARDLERAGILVALVFIALLHAKIRVQGLFVLPYAKPWLPTLLVVIGGVLGLALIVPQRVPAIARLSAIVLAAVVLRGVGLETVELDPMVRDMLPLVKSAQDTFAAGQNPYDFHQMQRGSVVPLTYLPGMWLLHGLPRLVGLDLRWTGIAADAAVAALLFWVASGVEARFRARAQGLAIAFAAAWSFSPSVHWNGLYAEPHAWWLVLALLIAATLRRKFWLAAVALGLALATRHFALVVAPFVVVHLLRTLGWRAALPRIGLAGVIAAVLLVPFVWRDPDTFWFGTYRWLVEYGPAHQNWFWFKFGFSGPLYKANAAAWMVRAQVASVLVMLAVAAVWRGPRAFVAPAGTAYVLFVMFNGIIWDSFYLGAALLPAFAAAGAHPVAAFEPAPVTKRVFVGGAVAAVLAIVAGAGLVVSLIQSERPSARLALSEFLAEQVKPNDAVIDRSSFRLAFVKGQPLFGERPPPTRKLGDHAFAPSFGPNGAFDARALWLVTRGSRDADLHAELANLGNVQDERFARFFVSRVELGSVRTRLSELVPSLSASLGDERLPPNASGGFRSSSVTYVEVAARPCRLGGGFRRMLYAHPASDAALRLSFSNVDLGRSLIVFGGIEDVAAVWGRAPVELRVLLDGHEVERMRLPNRAGVEWVAIDTSRFTSAHALELALTTADDTQRFVCLDALVLDAR